MQEQALQAVNYSLRHWQKFTLVKGANKKAAAQAAAFTGTRNGAGIR